MHRIQEILRLSLCQGLSQSQISLSCGVSQSSVSKYLTLARQNHLTASDIETLDLSALAQRLGLSPEQPTPLSPLPDFAYLHQELKKKGVTLQLLWKEYKSLHPDGYQYSQFCEYYRRWKRRLKPTLRQTHLAGDKLFVDYAGQTVAIQDPKTGKLKEAQIFVAVLGASNYTYAEATWTQGLPDWIASHIHTFEFLGGIPRMVVPDNLKSGVRQACYYDPDLNPTYRDMAVHYGTAVVPARVRKPRDKAKVESGVLIVERWILAVLRNRTFFSLQELNEAISGLLLDLNGRPFKKLPGTRRSWFDELDRPVLQPLPSQRFEFVQWKWATVNIDYHIELHRHYYSVPYSLVRQRVQVRYSEDLVEIFHQNSRVASHRRQNSPGRHSTHSEHMPKAHREHLKWTPSRLKSWAQTIGPSTANMVETILNSRDFPEQGYRSCLGILRLAKRTSPQRLEAACGRSIAMGVYRYRTIVSILDNHLESEPLNPPSPTPQIHHENVRGPHYYH